MLTVRRVHGPQTRRADIAVRRIDRLLVGSRSNGCCRRRDDTSGNKFELEGSGLCMWTSDTPTPTTVLHVPSIGLVVAVDAVYDGVHQYLAVSANGGIQKWIKDLDIIAALRPHNI